MHGRAACQRRSGAPQHAGRPTARHGVNGQTDRFVSSTRRWPSTCQPRLTDKFPRVRCTTTPSALFVSMCVNPYNTHTVKATNKLLAYKAIGVPLAFALTVHKIQGDNDNYITVELNNHSEYAWTVASVYVALSRSRTLDGLRLLRPITAESRAKLLTLKHPAGWSHGGHERCTTTTASITTRDPTQHCSVFTLLLVLF